MIQSAYAITAWWCSRTMTLLPQSTSPSNCSKSAKCSWWLVEHIDAAVSAYVRGELERLSFATDSMVSG